MEIIWGWMGIAASLCGKMREGKRRRRLRLPAIWLLIGHNDT
jgi:hypothetical protein